MISLAFFLGLTFIVSGFVQWNMVARTELNLASLFFGSSFVLWCLFLFSFCLFHGTDCRFRLFSWTSRIPFAVCWCSDKSIINRDIIWPHAECYSLWQQSKATTCRYTLEVRVHCFSEALFECENMCVSVSIHEFQHPSITVQPHVDPGELLCVVEDLSRCSERLVFSISQADTPDSCFWTGLKLCLSGHWLSGHTKCPVISITNLWNKMI